MTDLPRDRRYKSSIPADAIERFLPSCGNRSEKRAEYLVDGKVVGLRYWDEEGHLCLEKPLKNGLMHGVEYDWRFDGILTAAEPWFEGKPHGVAKQWSRSGKLIGTYKMVHGTGIDLWWTSIEGDDEPPFPLSEVMYLVEGRRHGFVWWLNDDQTTVFIESHWRHGKQHGIEREWNNRERLRRGYPKYYVDGEKVDKRRYLRAAAADPTLPSFHPDENDPARVFPKEIQPHLYKSRG